MHKLGLIITLLFSGLQVGWSQTEVCVKKIKDMYNLLESKVSEVDADHLFEMKFTMDVVYTNRGKIDSTSYDAHVISDQTKRYFFGNDTKVYQNKKTTASVSIKNKEVHLFDTPPEEYKSMVSKKYQLFEDTLLTRVDFASFDGKNKVKLYFKADNKLANGLMEISFDFGGKQLINSIQTSYYPNHQYSRIRVNYHTIDFSSKTQLLEKELLANILIGNQLIPEYKNYTLYDHRKNK